MRLFLFAAAAAMALAVASMIPPGTADFVAQTGNGTNGVATASLDPPTNATATVSGADINVSWTAAAAATGYRVSIANNGANSDCSAATYASSVDVTTTSYKQTGPAPNVTWCYSIVSLLSGTSWTSATAATASAFIGFRATAVALDNAAAAAASNCFADTAAANQIDCGNHIVITFNQPVDAASIPTGGTAGDTICLAGGTLILASASTSLTAACAATETARVGTLTSPNVAATANYRFLANYSLSADRLTLTITVSVQTYPTIVGTTTATVAGPWRFTPTNVAGRITSGGASACRTAPACTPTATGSF